jgi:hypothetical protein
MDCVLLLGSPQADRTAKAAKAQKAPGFNVTSKTPKKGTGRHKRPQRKQKSALTANAPANVKSASLRKRTKTAPWHSPSVADKDGVAEARLMEVYRLMEHCQPQSWPWSRARQLVADYPQFQLAQLVYADLMMGRTRPLQDVGRCATRCGAGRHRQPASAANRVATPVSTPCSRGRLTNAVPVSVCGLGQAQQARHRRGHRQIAPVPV